ncbi:MAG: hypothetical protein AB1758_36065, partial [Candidatus Eremiobacterota bacterium]
MRLLPIGPGQSLSFARPGAASGGGPGDAFIPGAEDPGLISPGSFFQDGPDPQLKSLASLDHRSPGAPQAVGDLLMVGGELFRAGQPGLTPLVREETGFQCEPTVGPGGSFYYLTQGGELVARQADGGELWRIPESGLATGVASSGDALWAAGFDAQGRVTVRCLNLAGAERWRHTLRPGELVAGLLSGDTLLVTGEED